MPDDARKLLWKADELQAQERATTQRLNPNSHLLRTGLSRLAGLQRAHVSLGRIPPGKDSFAYHAHMSALVHAAAPDRDAAYAADILLGALSAELVVHQLRGRGLELARLKAGWDDLARALSTTGR